jgi:hypothetical protein
MCSTLHPDQHPGLHAPRAGHMVCGGFMRNLALLAVLLCAPTLLATDTAIGYGGMRFTGENFEFNLRTQVQFRFTIQDERGNQGGLSRATNGRDFANFRIAAARTWMTGFIYDPSFQYTFRLNFAKPANELVELAHFRWALFSAVNFNAGQHKLPWNWEEIVPPDRLSFLERSYANATFNQNFAKGIWLDGRITRYLRYSGGIYGGLLRAQGDFRNKDGQLTSDAFGAIIDNDIMLNLRLETHPFGDVPYSLKDMRDEEERDNILFAAGVAANWFTSAVNDPDLRGDTGAAATGSGRSRVSQGTLAMTADAHFRWYGASVDIAVFWRHTEFHNKGINQFDVSNKQGIGDVEDFGFSAEIAYYLGIYPVSVGLRFNGVDADEFWGQDATLAGTTTRSRGIRPDALEVGGTATYYVFGERLKLSLDILYVSQQLSFAYDGGLSQQGVYNAPPSRRGQIGTSPPRPDYNVMWIVRFQLQWLL